MGKRQIQRDRGEEYENLANAIIINAVREYKSYLRFIKDKPDREELARKNQNEKFFYSKWFAQLTTVDGKAIVQMLKKEVWGK